ncbi:MAG: hypothetical protein NTY35_13055 [Planctomycetota bacterium]|nr:hypothetical protein [Planctomycetota bacterium]
MRAVLRPTRARAARSAAVVPVALLIAILVLAAHGWAADPQTGSRPTSLPAGSVSLDGEVLAPVEWLSGSAGARDETSQGRVFVEVSAAHETGFVGELLAIETRFGFDAVFLAENVIPLFRRPLDVPVQIEAPWLDDADSLALTRAFVTIGPEERVTIARNDRIAHARRQPDRIVNGRAFRVFALEVRRVERSSGILRLEGPRLHFAHGLGFTDDFVNGRTPTERCDAFVAGRDLEIAVAPLPDAGRPPGFHGAVGNFQIEAQADWPAGEPRRAGRVVLTIQGDGDLADVLAPDAASFPGFGVLGVLDDRGHARRRLTFDLERRSPDARRIPAIPLSFFDPRPPGRYQVVETLPIDLPPGEPGTPNSLVPAPARFGLRAALLLGGLGLALALGGWAVWRLRSQGKRTGSGSA